MSERNDELTRLSYTLGENMEDRFYVYMLQDDNGKPFYIGKGQGGRVFCHENDADKLLEVIRSENGDRNVDYSKLSEKIKTIIKSSGKVEKVIIKWGLTESEAFMCESALMNMYDHIFPETLTNISNGHASNAEKHSHALDGYKTKARNVQDFLDNVAIREVDFKEYCGNIPVVFITINKSYPLMYKEKCADLQREEFIYDSARGFWDINIRRTRYAKYVLALYRQIVVGVYPVNEDSWRVTTDFDEKEFPIYPKKYRENDKLLIQKNRTYDEYKRLGGQNDEKWFDTRRKRIGFEKCKPENSEEYSYLCKLKGTYLKDRFFKNQMSVYNYDVDKDGKLRFYNSANWC